MVSAISAVSFSTSTVNYDALTQATKIRLEALGIDTSGIRTESEGQLKLKEVQSTTTANKSQKKESDSEGSSKKAGSSNPSMDSIRQDVKALAADVGVRYSESDDVDDVLLAIEKKISSLAGSVDSSNKESSGEVKAYQARYDAIYTTYKSAQASQSMLTQGLDMLASYNMYSLGL